MPSVATRHLRAVTLAFASFAIGLGGHLQAGGHATSVPATAFAAGWCAVSGWSYSRRRLSGPGVAAVLLINQIVIHLALAIGSAMDMATVSAECHGGYSGYQQAVTMTTEIAGPGADTDHGDAAMAMSVLPDGWMILAHVLATLVTVAAIVAVEALCAGLAALANWLTRMLRPTACAPLVLTPPSTQVVVTLLAWTSRPTGARPGRGPPGAAVC